jgi:hypothetical protein
MSFQPCTFDAALYAQRELMPGHPFEPCTFDADLFAHRELMAGHPKSEMQMFFEKNAKPKQLSFFSGLDCLPGQADLFQCDGQREPMLF